MSTMTVDLKRLAGPVFSGRERGISARADYKLDEQEDRNDAIEVLLPENTYTVTSSFFLGLFGESVRTCGSVPRFEEKYHFKGPEFLLPILRGHAGLALRNKNLFS